MQAIHQKSIVSLQEVIKSVAINSWHGWIKLQSKYNSIMYYSETTSQQKNKQFTFTLINQFSNTCLESLSPCPDNFLQNIY